MFKIFKISIFYFINVLFENFGNSTDFIYEQKDKLSEAKLENQSENIEKPLLKEETNSNMQVIVLYEMVKIIFAKKINFGWLI